MIFSEIVVYTLAYFSLITGIFFLLSFFTKKRAIEDPPFEVKGKKLPFVSIVMNAWNEEKTIEEVLSSLILIDYPKNKYEIIVVDDGSTDKTFEKAKEFSKKFNFVKVFHIENKGAAGAKNFGIKKAKGKIIVSFDGDTHVEPSALKKMLGYFEDKNVMAITASLNVQTPKNLLQRIQWVEYMLGIFLRKAFCLTNSIHVVPGPFTAYRKEFFEKHGYFQEGNITEDSEMAMRIQSKGYSIRNSISANVYTKTPETFNSLLKQRIRWYYGFTKNAITYRNLFGLKHGNLGIVVFPSAFISVLLAIIAFGVFISQSYDLISSYFARLLVTNFSLIPSLSSIKLNYFIDVVVNFITTKFFLFILISISIFTIMIAIGKKKSRDKRKMVWSCILFLLIYWFLYTFWWLSMFFYKGVLRKKIKWGPRYY